MTLAVYIVITLVALTALVGRNTITAAVLFTVILIGGAFLLGGA